MFNKGLQIVVAVMLALSLMLLSSPAAYAVTEGEVGGSFQIGNTAPTVDAVELYSDAQLTQVAGDMTPLVEYYAKITVSDANYISNINQVRLELFYNATANATMDTPGVANTQNNAIFTWTKSGSVWAISAGANSTWTIETTGYVEPATMTNLSGDWVFAFKPGKVATESAGLAGEWDMYGKATDVAPASSDNYTRSKNILFYSEVTAVSTSTDWGLVTPDTGFADDINEVTAIAITYIANGDYSASVKADDWDGTAGGVGAAIYDDTGATSDNDTFSLKADTDAVFTGAVQVLKAGTVVDSAGTLTAEAGDVTTTNTLWLKLAATFADDVYTGSITYIIANR